MWTPIDGRKFLEPIDSPEPMDIDQTIIDEPMDIDLEDFTYLFDTNHLTQLPFKTVHSNGQVNYCTPETNTLIPCIKKNSNKTKKHYRVSYFPWVKEMGSPGVYYPLIDHENL
uniref:Uncharacterized protein n=1 Tax=Rhodnius prolixus TaxID=13249 RepID=T1HM44_RHOPR